MKKIVLLAALTSFIGAAVAADTGSDTAKSGETAGSPHGGMVTRPGALLPPGHPASIPADTQLANSGTVLEVVDSDIYTYVRVTSEKGPVWLAAYKTAVREGMLVRYPDGIVMSKFYSKALNRTFDVIIFVDSLAVTK